MLILKPVVATHRISPERRHVHFRSREEEASHLKGADAMPGQGGHAYLVLTCCFLYNILLEHTAWERTTADDAADVDLPTGSQSFTVRPGQIGGCLGNTSILLGSTLQVRQGQSPPPLNNMQEANGACHGLWQLDVNLHSLRFAVGLVGLRAAAGLNA